MNRTHWAVAGILLLTTTACGNDSKSGASEATTTSNPPTFCEAAGTAEAVAQLPQQLFNGTDPPQAVAVQAVVEEFSDRFAQMTALAPADIKSDVTVLDQAAEQLLNTVRSSDYDVSKLTTDQLTALNATFSSADYQAAQQKFLTYIDANCAGAPTTTAP